MGLIFILKKVKITLSNEELIVVKKRSLVKPFVECTANGYMIDAFGLFPAPANHTSILETIIKK